MNLTCPECKNSVELAEKSDLKVSDIVECQTCGTTLEILAILEDGKVEAEIVDEGK